ncbi:MAG: CDP-alcohol phosphatidyltransferase family protein [Bacteroidetes bacterium]|nr:CDP-alcohol phosphatidyltransferase family protein [Bacteroidota bacterium]
MKIFKHIPNILTCSNLFCGCLALVQAFEGDLIWAAYWVGIAAVFDFLDGFAARLLKAASPIGKDLDSLADMVTFGVVPGVVMYLLIQISTTNTADPLSNVPYIQYSAFVIPVFSALRLARFNNDSRQTHSFIGLPTPANALFFCALPLLAASAPSAIKMYIMTSMSVSVLLFLCVLFSFLLIAPLPMFSLKFKNFLWKENATRYLFLFFSIILLLMWQQAAISFIILLYIVFSVAHNFITKNQ